MANNQTYIALLRGINVGGHHKLPMADLKKLMAKKGFKNTITLLNSGNVIFEGAEEDIAQLEERMAAFLEEEFGFPVPTLIRSRKEIEQILASDPFKGIEVTKDTRLYLTFLRENPDQEFELPLFSEDGYYQIIELQDRLICSVLDVSGTKTTKGMDILEKLFGKDVTTRNWNTLLRIEKKLG
ncbi:MAG: DUF1697 domain-containing protein [Bacteroidia bacterium]